MKTSTLLHRAAKLIESREQAERGVSSPTCGCEAIHDVLGLKLGHYAQIPEAFGLFRPANHEGHCGRWWDTHNHGARILAIYFAAHIARDDEERQ